MNVGAHQLASDILAIVDRVDVDASEPERLPPLDGITFTLGQPVDGAPAGCDLFNPEPDHLPASGPDLLAGD